MIPLHDLNAAFAEVIDYWSPKVIAQVNDHYVKVAKLKGQLVWHDHAQEDELFYVVKGQLRIELEDKVLDLQPGQLAVIPKRVRHNPIAEKECWVVLMEPITTRHTGDIQTERTRSIKEQLG